MQIRLILVFLLFLATEVMAQPTSLDWVRTQGGKTGIPVSIDVATDASGNIYTVGTFSGVVDFDAGPGVFELSTGATNIQRSFLLKNSSNGSFEWVILLSETGSNPLPFDLTVDSYGDILITGTFYGIVDFDAGPGILNLGAGGSTNQFIVKYNTTGNIVWAKEIRRTNSLPSYTDLKIETDVSANIILIGTYKGNFDFDPGAGTSLISTTGYQMVISKFDFTGNLVWVKAGFQSTYFYNSDLSISPLNEIVIAGNFAGTRDFDPDSGVFNLTSTAYFDVYILKLDSLGSFLWVKQISGNYETDFTDVDVDYLGNIFITGTFVDTSDFDPSPAVAALVSQAHGDIYVAKYNSLGTFIWANRIGGKYDDVVNGLSTDNSGNVYFTGTFIDTCDFNPDFSVFQMVATTYGTQLNRDIYVCKLSGSGYFHWAKQAKSYFSDGVVSIDVDASGNVITTGFFVGNTDFDPGPVNLNVVGTGKCMFVWKLNTSGNVSWANGTGYSSAVYPIKAEGDISGFVYTSGTFYGTVDFDDSPNQALLTSVSPDTIHDIFITKTSSAGVLSWVRQISGVGIKFLSDITIDFYGNSYLTGSFYGTVDFDPGPAVYNLTTANNQQETFVLRLNSSGNFVGAYKLTNSTANGFHYSSGHSIKIDNQGKVLVTGRFYGDVDFDPSPAVVSMNAPGTRPFVMKLNANGTLIWARKFEGVSGFGLAHDIETDNSGNIYTTGWTFGVFDFDPGPSTFNLGNSNSTQAFISVLDPSGNYKWAGTIGGGQNSLAEGYNIKTDNFGNIFIMGAFQNNIDFDPGVGVYYMFSNSIGSVSFIAKIDSSRNFNWAITTVASGGSNFGYNPPFRNFEVDGNGFSYITSKLTSSGDIDPGPDTVYVNASNDLLLIKFDPYGKYSYHNLIVGTNGVPIGRSVSVNFWNDVIISGSHSGITDFDPNQGVVADTSSGIVDGFTFKLTQCPSSSVIVTPSDSVEICSNSSIQLVANSASGVTYQWYRDSLPIAGATSMLYNTSIAGNYFVVVMSNCDTASSALVSVAVNTQPLPVVSVVPAGNSTICSGDSLLISASSSPGYTYQWILNGTYLSGSVGSSHQAISSGTYLVIATDTSSGCSAISQDSVIVDVLPPPIANLTALTSTSICLGDSVHLNVFAPTAMSYQWIRSNIPVSGAVVADYFAKTTGLYKCLITDNNGCSVYSNALKVKIVCMPPLDEELKTGVIVSPNFSLSPNPASGEVIISCESEIHNIYYVLVVVDVTGKQVLSEQIICSSDFNTRIATGYLNPGIYFFHFSVNGIIEKSFKVIIMDN